MSGFEVIGVVLGAFPLIISSLEHWRDVAKISGLFWQVRKEFTKCLNDVKFHDILYKRNLKELLLPIVNDADEVARLMGDPGRRDWGSSALQERLEWRLQESYALYMITICEMNETVNDLRKELALDKATVQNELAPSEPTKSAKSKWEYKTFRLKFSLNEPVRNKLFDQLKKCNERLKTLLSTSDTIPALKNITPANAKQTSAVETISKTAWKKLDLLFKALQKAWKCSCQQHHFVNLRLEHRTIPEMSFEVILMFVASSLQGNTPWSWRELECGQMIGCPSTRTFVEPSTVPQSPTSPRNCTREPLFPTSARRKEVAFTKSAIVIPKIESDILLEPSLKLCQLLGDKECGKCMGIIGHDDETYHLHPFMKRKRPDNSSPLTLDDILSPNNQWHLTRRQRYSIALVLASSVAQLQFTPWLRTGLTKKDIVFFPCEDDHFRVPYKEPFIRQGFSIPPILNTEANDCSFYSLGIILLELCFGRRLEDHAFRRKHPPEAGEAKQAFDLMAALKWSQNVGDEGGEDYASAVSWCFTSANSRNQSWRGEVIKNVVRPLEMCQEHFKTVLVC